MQVVQVIASPMIMGLTLEYVVCQARGLQEDYGEIIMTNNDIKIRDMEYFTTFLLETVVRCHSTYEYSMIHIMLFAFLHRSNPGYSIRQSIHC